MISFLDHVETALIVGAHPDDELLGCGGTVLKLSALGCAVHIMILSGVTTSRFEHNDREEAWKQSEYADEAQQAADKLGAASLTRVGLDDNRFDGLPLLEVIKPIEKLKSEINPDLVMTHDFTDLNVDHRIAHQAVMTAFRPDTEKRNFRIMTFETLSSTELQDQALASFRPNCYVDIGDQIKNKIEAMAFYKSELRDYPHPRSLEGIEIMAKKRGIEACVEYAEVFRIAREIVC